MSETADIYKAAGIVIRDRKLLVERSVGKKFFISPGGSIEPGESAEDACIRELFEEFTIAVKPEDLTLFGVYRAPAAGQESKVVEMTAFMVKAWSGQPKPSSEVEEMRWITSEPEEGIKLGSIFEHEVIPQLKSADLID